MIETLLIIGYVLVCAWGFRFAAGAYISDMTYGGRIGGEDVFIGMIIGFLGALIAPAVLAARIVYVLWRKYAADSVTGSRIITAVFPAPKEIETKREKRERLEREKSKQISAQRSEINARERELGLELTRW